MKAKILVVDDDPIFLQVTKSFLQDRGFIVETAPNGEDGMVKFSDKEFDVVISDLFMLPMDGISFLKEVRKMAPDVVFLIVTGQASIETAVEAMKLGAGDYVVKPWSKDGEELTIRLDKLMEKRQARLERNWLRQELREKHPIDEFHGQDPKMQNVFNLMRR